MAKYAVLIGNGAFPHESKLQDLRCPVLDVVGLEKVLVSPERGAFDEILVLKDKPRDEVEHSLNRMLNKAGRDDLVLLYYSGHGMQSFGGQLYLTTFKTEVEVLNTTAVGLNKVYELINESACRKIVLILDCCYSGAAGASFKGDISSELKQVNVKTRGTYLITASTEIQPAMEKPEDDYSLFTKHLIAGLESGAADKDGDGLITIDELYQYVHDKVLDENPNQQPTKTSKGERGELMIAKSGRNSREDLIKKIRGRLLELSQVDDEFFSISAEAVSLFKLSPLQLSELQKQKYVLLEKLVNKSLTPTGFIRAWDRLSQSSFLIEEEERKRRQTEQQAEIEAKKERERTKPVEKPIKKPEKVNKLLNSRSIQKEDSVKVFSLKPLSIIIVLLIAAGAGVYKLKEKKKTPSALPTTTATKPEIITSDEEVTSSDKAVVAIEPEIIIPDKEVVSSDKAVVAIEPEIIIPDKEVVSPDNIIGSIESEMEPIIGGTFQMGSPESEVDRGSNEKLHQVKVDDFYMGKYEVSNTEYVAFLNAVKKRGTKKQPWFQTKAEDSYSQITGSVGNFKVEAGYENYPAVNISWYGAMAYAQWLSIETGKNYRLPTEAQWEYAARAGTKTAFSTGDCISTEQANYDGDYDYNNCGKGEDRKATVAVNSFSANDFGLYNMHGNVWEWTCSVYEADYKGKEQQCLSKNDASSNKLLPVLRGGSWDGGAQYLRSAYRYRYNANGRDYYVGFRLVRM